MMRVVDILPDKAEIAANGLVEKDFTVNRDVYRHFAEQYRRDFLDFKRRFYENGGTADGSTDPDSTGGTLAASDEACIEAFERSRPPFYYRRGSLYRYRIDPTGSADRPIILDRYERSEVTGSLVGLPFTSQRQGILMRLCIWIEKRLRKREQREKN